MNKVMLDIETMGKTANSAIIAIGAVKFNKEITDEFYQIIDLESAVNSGLEMDPSTVMWWMKQSDEARAQFSSEAMHLTSVLINFSEWIEKEAEVWGNGADFDNVILNNAYQKCGIKTPWDFWNNRCYRTVKNMNKQIQIERVGVYHCAVDDAKTQAHHLMKILSL